MLRDRDLIGLAMVLSKSNKIKVTITGENSYCNNAKKHINIARMPNTRIGSMLMVGLIAHEVGHMSHTTEDKPPGMHGDLTNIIEDIRVETLSIIDRPGTRFNLGAVTKHYATKGGMVPETLNHALLGKVMAYGRGRLLQQDVMGLEAQCDEMIDDAFGQTFIDEIEKIVKHIPKLTNTKQTIAMADKIVNLILNPPPPPSPPPQPQPGEGDGQGAGGQAPPAAPEETEDGSGGQKSTSDGAGPPTPQQVQEMLQEESGFGDLSKMIQEEMDELAAGPGAGCPLLPDVDTWKPRGPLDEVEAISTSSRMRAKMIGLLESVKRKPTSFGLNGRKIATSRLPKLALGDPKIFQKKTETFAANTAVVILCDYSGSMAGERRLVAIPACFALHHTLYGLRDVSCCSMGFTGCSIGVHMLVDFDVKPKSASFNHPCPGNTPLTEALWAGRAKLLARPEPRKILLVLTDGDPDDHRGTLDAVKDVVSSGIELAALGIQHRGVKNYFANHRIIHTLAELPANLFEIMDELLVKRR